MPSAVVESRSDEVVEIRPNKGFVSLRLGEFWAYRDLLREMIARDMLARYKQSFLGKAWVIVQPLTLMTLYYFIFGVILELKTGVVPFPVFLLGGVLIWQLVAASATNISYSMVSNAHLMNKVYFPRLLIPVSQSVAAVVDFAFGLLVLAGFMAVARVALPPQALLAPLFVVYAIVTGMALGLWLAPLNVKYRDIGQAVPLVLQVFMYASPVFYSPTLVPEQWRSLYYLNPGAGIIQGFRWSLMGDVPPEPIAWVCPLLVAALFLSGLYFFRSREAELVDDL